MNDLLQTGDGSVSASRSWTVAGLLLAVSDALAARFSAVTVRGELSGFTRAASGHCYFTLKDAGGAAAAMRCAMFRRAALGLPFAPRDGQQVELRGRLAVYEARGEFQMIVEAMQAVGAGSLYEEFLRLRARLEAQGLFDPARKRPLPAFPRAVAVVTSAVGAALHDVLSAWQRRAPHLAVLLFPTSVQGAEAPAAIVAALAAANRSGLADLVVLCRGGGSLEDLWAFNDERVVRAVVGSALPVICGVGHETDWTLADMAADLRAPTPTAAAELAAPARDDALRALQDRAERMRRRLQTRIDNAAQRLDTLGLRLQRPGHLVATQASRLVALSERHHAAVHQALRLADQARQHTAARMLRAGGVALERKASQTDRQAARLQAVDPRQVLARGYAWVAAEDGRAVVTSKSLQVGQPLRAVWSDGEAGVTVTELNGVSDGGGRAGRP
jgi:exodeoxyribonuclease VII large subunit